jgi:hypothetical protein
MLLKSELQQAESHQMSRSQYVMLYLRYRRHLWLSMFLFEILRNQLNLLHHRMLLELTRRCNYPKLLHHREQHQLLLWLGYIQEPLMLLKSELQQEELRRMSRSQCEMQYLRYRKHL